MATRSQVNDPRLGAGPLPLDAGLGLAVGDVNVMTRRGRHTTTAAVWIPFGDDGVGVDTAGIREFGLFGIPHRNVPWLFRDLAKAAVYGRSMGSPLRSHERCRTRGRVP